MGLREEKRERTNKKIEEAALFLFEKMGFEKTTMAKIAGATGIGVGTLYNYFPSKTEMLFAIIERNSAPYLSELREIVDSQQKLSLAIEQFFTIYIKSFNVFEMNIWRALLSEVLICSRSDRERIQRIDLNFIELLESLFYNRLPKISEGDRKNLVQIIYTLLLHQLVRQVMDNEPAQIETLMEQVRLILNPYEI